MRRFMRLLADARRYPPGTPPHVLLQDLRQIIARAQRVNTQPRIGTARFESTGACCKACLIARQNQGVLRLLGLAVESLPGPTAMEFETAPRSATIKLQWVRYPTLAAATVTARGSGIYILRRGDRPVYVGQSIDLPRRLAHHLWCSQRHHDAGLAAWVANVPAKHLSAVEHTLVRALRGRVTNALLQSTLTVGPRQLAISNLLPPGLTSRHINDNKVQRPSGGQFEWTS
jgi:hypothetical protein